MNNVDKQYLDLMQDIIDNGVWKETRSGRVKSVFGRMMRFNLKEGFPILTTKKVFYKGIIHELLWFLSGNTNIEYLVNNNVHIWDDDAYRHYKSLVTEHNEIIDDNKNEKLTYFKFKPKEVLSKEDFISKIKEGSEEEDVYVQKDDMGFRFIVYRLGDLGPIYGKQWRDCNGVDQIKNVIETLKTNPNDRRIIVSSWNVSDLDRMALPPCHYTFQFYTRELSLDEIAKLKYEIDDEKLAEYEAPKYELSCSFTMRSNDFCLGNPYNIAQYAMLTHMIAHCVNMTVGDLVYFGNDVHIYENHMEGCKEQLSRNPKEYNLPTLWLNPSIKYIDSFTFEDIMIDNYESYPSIKFPLSVGS